MTSPVPAVVLISGTGSNLAAILRATDDADYPVRVVAVGTDVPTAPGLAHAEAAGVPTFVVPPADYPDRASWNVALGDAVATYRPELVVCAGFMRILDQQFVDRFAGRIVNTHPALLPAFPGAHAIRDALAAGVKVTGCTVHLIDEGVDTGPILAQQAVEVSPTDTEETLRDRIQRVERPLLVDTVGRMARDGWTVQGRRVTLGALDFGR